MDRNAHPAADVLIFALHAELKTEALKLTVQNARLAANAPKYVLTMQMRLSVKK